MDRIDPLYFAHSTRLDMKEETRIKATSDEATEWARQMQQVNGVSILMYLSFLFDQSA
jgi:ubiquitin conjugation factor E4 B